jgi:hypothetical protein
MKIEINLSEIIDENGEYVIPEFQDLVLQGVVQNVTRMVQEDICEEVKGQIQGLVKQILDDMIPDILAFEFQETGGYGRPKGKTITVRDKILKDMERAMVWKDGSFDSDKSPYTRVVKSAVEKKLSEFAKEFRKEIDAKFVAAAMEYAATELRKRAGIK